MFQHIHHLIALRLLTLLQAAASGLNSASAGTLLASSGFSAAQLERLQHQIMAFKGLNV